MKATAGRTVVRSCETTHPGGESAWVSDVTTRTVRWSLAPAEIPGGSSSRRVWIATDTVRSLWIARKGEREGRAVLPNMKTTVASPAFSPQGDLLAFLVSGEAEGFSGPVMSDIAVLDLNGRPVVRPSPAASEALGLPLPASTDPRLEGSASPAPKPSTPLTAARSGGKQGTDPAPPQGVDKVSGVAPRRIVSFAWDETGSAVVLYVERMDGGKPVPGSERVKVPRTGALGHN
jgi:hypothetical protein